MEGQPRGTDGQRDVAGWGFHPQTVLPSWLRGRHPRAGQRSGSVAGGSPPQVRWAWGAMPLGAPACVVQRRVLAVCPFRNPRAAEGGGAVPLSVHLSAYPQGLALEAAVYETVHPAPSDGSPGRPRHHRSEGAPARQEPGGHSSSVQDGCGAWSAAGGPEELPPGAGSPSERPGVFQRWGVQAPRETWGRPGQDWPGYHASSAPAHGGCRAEVTTR